MSAPTPDYGELLPCPFCGAPARVAHGTGWPGDEIIECSNDECCRASMTGIWMQKTARELWNTRAGIPNPAAEIARLKEALDSFDEIDKERNDALKVCMSLLEDMHFNRRIFKVDAYADRIEAAMAQIKTCYDPHA